MLFSSVSHVELDCRPTSNIEIVTILFLVYRYRIQLDPRPISTIEIASIPFFVYRYHAYRNRIDFLFFYRYPQYRTVRLCLLHFPPLFPTLAGQRTPMPALILLCSSTSVKENKRYESQDYFWTSVKASVGGHYNLFRSTVPFWEWTTPISSILSPKRGTLRAYKGWRSFLEHEGRCRIFFLFFRPCVISRPDHHDLYSCW